MLGEYSYGGTPSYIPNLEVKPIYADGTWLEAAWESMDLPSYFLREASASLSFFYLNFLFYFNFLRSSQSVSTVLPVI